MVSLTTEEIALPIGTVLDWRFCSHWNSPDDYAEDTFNDTSVPDRGFVLLFDEQGLPLTLAKVNGLHEVPPSASLLSGSTNYLVRAYRDFDQEFITADPETREFELSQQILSQEDSRWVTSSATTGKITTSGVIKPTSTDSIRSMLFQSRTLARVR